MNVACTVVRCYFSPSGLEKLLTSLLDIVSIVIPILFPTDSVIRACSAGVSCTGQIEDKWQMPVGIAIRTAFCTGLLTYFVWKRNSMLFKIHANLWNRTVHDRWAQFEFFISPPIYAGAVSVLYLYCSLMPSSVVYFECRKAFHSFWISHRCHR